MADYKIELGVHVKTNEIREQISKYNTNSNNAKLKLGIKLDTNDLKKQINSLNLGSTSGSKGIAIPVNTQSLEASLKEVKGIIADIKASMGTLDGGDMKSLLSSVNQIATALGRAENESDNLLKSLNALSKKDFNINFGIDMNKKGLNTIGYGRAARKQVIPELEAQIKYLENLFGGQQATMNKLASQGSKVGFDVFTDFADFNSDSAIKKMEAMEKYINSLKKLAAIDNINLDGFNEIHKDASALINDITGIENAVDKVGDVPEKLKNLFGSGVDAERLSQQLDAIVADLSEIKTALQGLSSGVSLDGLTQSFNNLSASLEKLVGNATQVQGVLNNGLNTSGVSAGTQRAIQEQSALAQTTTQTAEAVAQSGAKVEQAFNQMASASNLDPINLRDDTSEADEFAAAITRVKQLMSNIGKIQIGQVSTSKGVQELQVLENQLESLSAEWNETVAEINAKGGMGLPQLQQLRGQMEATTRTIEQLKGRIVDVKSQLASKIQGNFGNYENQLLSLEGRIKRLATQTPELKAGLEQVRQALTTLKSADGTDALIAANERYKTTLKQVETQIKQNEIAERKSNDAAKLQQEKQQLALKMSNWLRDNSAAAKQFGGEIQKLQGQLKSCGNITGVKQIGDQFKTITLQAKEANATTLTFGDRLKKQFSQYSSYLSVASLFMYASQGLRDMFEQVKLIDTAMTELKKVTDETDASYNKFLSNAATRSREIGTTIDGLVSSTADFARLGYGFKDAQGLAEVANIYAVVGDEINGVEGATESLISTMAAFKGEMDGMSNSDFAMSIIDKFNEIGELIA